MDHEKKVLENFDNYCRIRIYFSYGLRGQPISQHTHIEKTVSIHRQGELRGLTPHEAQGVDTLTS